MKRFIIFISVFLAVLICGVVVFGWAGRVKVVSYRKAREYSGRVMYVEMPVAYAFFDRGKEYFFSSRINPHHAHMVAVGGNKEGFFTVSIPREYFHLFPDGFDGMIKGKNILVTGEITWYQGDPHIIVTKPAQISIKD